MLAVALPWHTSLQAQPPLPPPSPAPISASPIPAAPPDASNSFAAPAPTASPNPAAAAANQVQPGETVFQVTAPFSKINLRVLDSRVLELANRIKVVDGFDQDKISVKALSPHRIRIHAEAAGVTSLKLIDEFDNMHTIEVFVEPDTRELKAYLDRLFPGSAIEVVGIRDGVVLRGWVTEPSQIPEIMSIAEQFYEIVHPQLTVAGPSQVQLHVKVIEVQRSKLRELGFNFLMTGQQYYVANSIGSLAPVAGATLPFGGPPAVNIAQTALANSEMQFAITGNNNIFQGFLHALQSESLAKILAEPILVTTSGRPATVHSGGEFPVLVPQSFGNLSIQWREFGVRLEAVPIVLGEGRLRLDLAPEVSERDFSNSVTINGLVVPGITSRSVNTQVEMRFGETLMIGGLISTREQGTTQKIPFLGELPWIGAAFSRKSFNVGETELVILVTPQMVSPMAPCQVPAGGPGLSSTIPTDRELYLDGNLEVPNYGPQCPGGNCPPSTELIAPPSMGPIPPGMGPAPPAMEPTPAVSANKPASRGKIQQASGEKVVTPGSRTTIVNPFHPPVESNEFKPAREKPVTQASASVQTPIDATKPEAKKPEAKTRSSIFDSRSLPGLIEPKSDSNQKAAAEKQADK